MALVVTLVLLSPGLKSFFLVMVALVVVVVCLQLDDFRSLHRDNFRILLN